MEFLIIEYLRLEAEAKAIKAKQDEIKRLIIEQMDGKDAITCDGHTVKNTEVLSHRFDTKRFKEDFGNASYSEYCKPIISFKFTVK